MSNLKWPWDSFPEDLSTWESAVEEHEKSQEELGKLDAEIIFLKSRLRKARKLIEEYKKDKDWLDNYWVCDSEESKEIEKYLKEYIDE